MTRQNKDSAIAAAITFIVALLILLGLFFGGLYFDREELAKASTPEIQNEEEELFIEPELVELGEENSQMKDSPSPSTLGEPQQAEEEQTEKVTVGENPKPAPPVDKLVKSNKPQEVKAVEPTKSDKEEKEVKSKLAGKFTTKNGSPEGIATGSGSGGSGIGVAGNARGRTFISCPKPDVTLRHKTVVTVRIVIDAEGKVVSASASGSADATIRRKCEQAARQARWTAKAGAAETHGTLTFTITPQ